MVLVWGEHDGWIPLERGRRLHEAMPGSRLEIVEEAGHLVQEDRPEPLLHLLLQHLR